MNSIVLRLTQDLSHFHCNYRTRLRSEERPVCPRSKRVHAASGFLSITTKNSSQFSFSEREREQEWNLSRVDYTVPPNASHSETIKFRNDYSSSPINKINLRREKSEAASERKREAKSSQEPKESIISLIPMQSVQPLAAIF